MASISASDFWRTYEELSDKNSGTPGVSIMGAKVEASGMVQAVLSDLNQSRSFFSSMSYATGARNETIVKYKTEKRYLASEVGDTAIADYCTSTDTTEWVDGSKELLEYSNMKFEIEYDDIKKVGKYNDGQYANAQVFFDNKLRRAANAILQQIDGKLIDKFIADKGINLTTAGVTPILATGINSTTDPSINQSFELAVDNEFALQNYYGKVLTVGDGIFRNYINLLKGARTRYFAGDLRGESRERVTDQGQIIGGYSEYIEPFTSRNIDAKTAVANSVLAFEPGTFMWAGANRFQAGENHGDMITTTRILDMGQGIMLPVDVTLKNVQCTRALPIVMTVELNWDTLSFDPATAFKTGDALEGSNGMAQFTIAQV